MTWDYVAGFLDGDGCIYTYSTKNKRTPLVSFDQRTQDVTVLVEIQEFLLSQGIRTSLYARELEGRSYAALRSTSVNGTTKLLEMLLPLLIVKKEAAEIALCDLRHRRQCAGRDYEDRYMVAGFTYLFGVALSRVAKRFGVGQAALRRFIVERDGKIRNLSESHRSEFVHAKD